MFFEDRELNLFTELNESSVYRITMKSAINGIGKLYIHATSKALSVFDNTALNQIYVYVKQLSGLRISGLKNVSLSTFGIGVYLLEL